jgi:hypothetical protein
MTAMIHTSHSIVIIDHVQVAECSKCWSCLCHEIEKLILPCTKEEGK